MVAFAEVGEPGVVLIDPDLRILAQLVRGVLEDALGRELASVGIGGADGSRGLLRERQSHQQTKKYCGNKTWSRADF